MRPILPPLFRSSITVVVLAGLTMPPGQIWAQSPTELPQHTADHKAHQQARQLRKAAEEAFFINDYDTALGAFAQAYELSPHPSDLFNMGRIYEEQGLLPEALVHYERFVEQPRVPLRERAAAAERIEVLRKLVEDDSSDDVAAKSGDRSEGREPVRFSPAPSPVDQVAERRAKALTTSGASLLAVGAALALGGGLGFGLAARRNSDQVNDLGNGRNPDRLTLTDAEQVEAEGKDYEALQIASLTTGAALAAAGTGLLVAGLLRRQKLDSRGAVAPVVGRQAMGFVAQWRF